MDKRRKYKILYYITIVIAYLLFFIACVVGFVFVKLTLFYIVMCVLGVDIVFQVVFWNKF